MEQPERFSLTETNETQINLFVAAAYFQKNETARGTQLIRPRNFPPSRPTTNLLATAAQAYLAHGLFHNASARRHQPQIGIRADDRPGFQQRLRFHPVEELR